MANFKGHIVGGFVAGVGTSVANSYFLNPLNLPQEYYPIFVGISLLGAMFPDTDIASKSRKYIYFIFLLLAGYFFFEKQYLYCGIIGIFSILPAISKHRGWTHSKLAMIGIPLLFSLILLFFSFPVFLFQGFFVYCLVGYASHLLLDGKLF